MKYEDLDLIFTKKLMSVLKLDKLNESYSDHQQIMLTLSKNENISLDIIDNCTYVNPHEWDWSWGISRHPKLTIEFIERHIDKPWNWGEKGLSKHKCITVDFLIKYSNKKWNWITLTHNKSIPKKLELLERFIDKPWDWKEISSFNIPLKFIEKNIHKTWSWSRLGLHRYLTIDFVNKYQYKCWNWNIIFNYSVIPFTDLVTKLEISDYNRELYNISYHLSVHHDLQLSIVKNNIDFPWDWNKISCHKNITWKMIKDNPNLPWNWEYVTGNPNITFKIIQENIDKDWNYNKLANEFGIFNWRYKHNWIYQYRLEYIASLRIHRFWRDVCHNPVYAFARKRLEYIAIQSD
tara:strand:- start:3858 stop:4904 length:1047 start_codon:yes stop_codon:yes gene_type:complete